MSNSNLLRRLKEPAFGTETTERLLMKDAADAIDELVEAIDKTRKLVAASAFTGLCNEELYLNNRTLSELCSKYKAKP